MRVTIFFLRLSFCRLFRGAAARRLFQCKQKVSPPGTMVPKKPPPASETLAAPRKEYIAFSTIHCGCATYRSGDNGYLSDDRQGANLSSRRIPGIATRVQGRKMPGQLMNLAMLPMPAEAIPRGCPSGCLTISTAFHRFSKLLHCLEWIYIAPWRVGFKILVNSLVTAFCLDLTQLPPVQASRCHYLNN